MKTSTPDELMRSIAFKLAINASDYDIHRGSLEDLFLELTDKNATSRSGTDSKGAREDN